ncbi:hypothetical protein GN956_G23999 [Arapaima gigas]
MLMFKDIISGDEMFSDITKSTSLKTARCTKLREIWSKGRKTLTGNRFLRRELQRIHQRLLVILKGKVGNVQPRLS